MSAAPGALKRVGVEPAALLERVLGRKHRVHVAGQQQPPLGVGPDAQDQVAAVRELDFAALGIDRGDRRRLAQRDVAGQRRERLGQLVRLPLPGRRDCRCRC